ncbi:hypothetical protein D3C81_1831910 [compost metagenome]
MVHNFSPLPAHKHPVAANPRKILVAGEIEHTQLVSKVQGSQGLDTLHRRFGRRRTAALRPLNNRGTEMLRADADIFIADTEQTADQADAVIPVRSRYLRLADSS